MILCIYTHECIYICTIGSTYSRAIKGHTGLNNMRNISIHTMLLIIFNFKKPFKLYSYNKACLLLTGN